MRPSPSRIIAVHDQASQLQALERCFRGAGYDFQGLNKPQALFELLKQQPQIDLIITNLNQPTIDGWELCQRLRNHPFPAYRQIPILVTSATFAGLEINHLCRELGVNGFLCEPFTCQRLLREVRLLLLGHSQCSQLKCLFVGYSPEDPEVLLFQGAGYLVTPAASLEQASSQIALQRYELLISRLPPTAAGIQSLFPSPNPWLGSILLSDTPPSPVPEALTQAGHHVLPLATPAESLLKVCEGTRQKTYQWRIQQLLEERTEQLRTSERKYQVLFNAVPEIMICLDSQGRIEEINGPGQKALGHLATPLVGQTLSPLLAQPQAIEQAFSQAMRIGQAEGQFQLLPAQPNFTCDVTFKRVLLDQEFFVLMVARDVSEPCLLKEQLQQSQKLEAIGTLAGGIAHDFNNLLGGILGYCNLLKIQSHLPEEVQHSTEVIERAAKKAAELTHKLLGFARQGKTQPVEICLHRCLDDCIELLSRTIDKRIEIRKAYHGGTALISGDPSQIDQVLLNLAVNARDAIEGEGAIGFATRLESLRETDPKLSELGLAVGDYWVLSVEDTGSGIPPELSQRIFEPFFTTKEPGRGTGMGLPMVYGIVRSHRGGMRFESSPNLGTTFEIYLPRILTSASAQSLPALVEPLRGSGQILVVDDEELLRNVCTRLLRHLGYSPICAADGQEGVAMYQQHWPSIDLVIIDMVMPKMNGEECFHRLKAINPRVKAVLSSGHCFNHTAQNLLDQGLVAFIQKPYQLNELSDVLSRILV